MSLCALLYHNMKGISNPSDLKQIVHIGNQLYSSLSKLKQDNHSYCLQNYQQCLQYCREIEGYQYCMGLKRAFESLISEQYRLLILKVGCIAVGIIYCADNPHFKVFDSCKRSLWRESS